MSLHFEDSPVSDSKMDISETTTDSAGISPLGEELHEQQHEVAVAEVVTAAAATQQNHNDDGKARVGTTTKEFIENSGDSIVDANLDNRIIRPELLSLETLPQRQIIARTLANSHPLMSPTNTDSDTSEPYQQNKCNNFPDVVPRKEHKQQQVPLQQQQQLALTGVLDVPAVLALNKRNNQLRSNKPKDAKLGLLRGQSPDILSSESDADVSQYLAAVESNFQAVALLPNNAPSTTSVSHKIHVRKSHAKRLIGCEDISSLDSISNHSFDDDEDIEHNLASLSPSSSLIDGLDGEEDEDEDIDDDDDDDDCEGPELLPDNDDDLDLEFGLATTPTPPNVTTASQVNKQQSQQSLPQYTAAEERRDSRNWQKITLPDGRTREIDMRVIEPYKRVLSHGGYLKAGGQNAIVIFCACHLPDRSRADYNYVMDNLFLYVVKTLEQLVTDDYVLIYLHGGSSRRNVPPFPWLKRCYQLLDRRLRKSLKHMYLVHPTFWIKSLVWMARPFVSTKFWRKLIYVKSLEELGTHVAVEKAAIPEKVKLYDAKRN